jgi:hypothetical protein
MQALPQQFRDVVYYADVEGLHASQRHRGRRQLRRLLGVVGAGTETMSTA